MNKIKPFINLDNLKDRFDRIKENLQAASLGVKLQDNRLVVEKQDNLLSPANQNIWLKFMQDCLNKEFEIVNQESANVLLPSIVQYLENRQDDNTLMIIECGMCDLPFTKIEDRKSANTEIIADLIFNHNIIPANNAIDFKIEDLSISNEVIKECSLQCEDRKYNPGKMLEGAQVSAITYNVLKSQGLEANDYLFYQLNIADEGEKQLTEKKIKLALLRANQGKPVALQLSNQSHWITLCLLPNKFDRSKVALVMMDGREKDAEVQALDHNFDDLSVEDRKRLLEHQKEAVAQHHLDPNKIIEQLKELGPKLDMNISQVYDLSVKGQQQDNSCGLDTALNTAAIIQTHENYDAVDFDPKDFQQALNHHIYYQNKDNRYYILNQESSLGKEVIVKEIGTHCLLSSLEEGINKPAQSLSSLLKTLVLPEESLQSAQESPVQALKGLESWLASEENKMLLARQIRNIKLKVTEGEVNLPEYLKTVLGMAKPGQDISIGLINSLVLWIGELLGLNFDIVQRNQQAKNWVDQIKQKQLVERQQVLAC